ncbi:MAG: LysR family transcriptional regulator [Rhodobacteraceae bacterium]|nr:LysR family transcriptional regulator [Paracoccaceae bacterium]
MPRRLPPLNALRAYEAAGRHQSFSRAAEELGVNHSAISRHVRGLEDRLGVQLFRDLPRGVALTQAGARYLERVSPAFDAIADASEALADRVPGTLTLNSELMFAAKILIPHLGDFYERHPEIEIRLEGSSELVDIERYEADLAIRYFNSGVPDVSSVLVSNAAMYPYISPDLLAEPVQDPAQLLQFKLLRDRSGDPWSRWFARVGGVDLARVPKPKWRLRVLLSLEAAVAGQGVFLAAADIVDADVRAGRLIKCHEFGLAEGSYHLLFGAGVLRRKPARLFRDWLLDECAPFRFESPGRSL